MRAVIAEITAENLELKKEDLRLENLSRVPADTRAAVMQIVAQTKKRSGWQVYRTLAALGVPRSVYYAWKRRERLENRAGNPCRVYEVGGGNGHILRFTSRQPRIRDFSIHPRGKSGMSPSTPEGFGWNADGKSAVTYVPAGTFME